MRNTSTTTRFVGIAAVGLLALGLAACGADDPATGERISAPSAIPEPTETPEPTREPTETSQPTREPTAEAEPTAEHINGRWCPTPESPDSSGCVSIELPSATYDDGMVVDITANGGPTETDGGFSFSMIDAPFGVFYPAGSAIPDYYAGSDLPDQDRVWSGQSGTMLIRDE